MTEEQIRKKAEKQFPDSLNMQSAYIMGAKSMRRELNTLQRALKSSDGFWISVKDRLPRADKLPTEEQYNKNKRYYDKKLIAAYVVAYLYNGDVCFCFANYIKRPYNQHAIWEGEEGLRSSDVTHWIPIPWLNAKECHDTLRRRKYA